MSLLNRFRDSRPDDGLDPIRHALRNAAEAPEDIGPWRQVKTLAVGGLRAVGFDRTSEALVVVSSHGQSVLDATTGDPIWRDRAADGYDPAALKAARLDHPAAERIDMAGHDGGALRLSTTDGWTCAHFALHWPDTYLILQPPRASIYALKPNIQGNAEFHLLDRRSDDIRAFGFSWSGHSLILATSCDLQLWARPAPLPLT